MEEGALRLEPQAYGATIGVPGVRGMGFRVAAVCAALVSLLAVSCAVLMSGVDSATPPRGLPGFELSLNSAMETFFQNTAARERKEAAAQQLTVQQLSVASRHAPAGAAAAKPEPKHSRAVTPGGTPRRPATTLRSKNEERALSAAPHITAWRGTAKRDDRDEFLHKLQKERADVQVRPRGAKMEGLATEPAGMLGLDNKPWAAPSSDFQAEKARKSLSAALPPKQTDFDVSLLSRVPC